MTPVFPLQQRVVWVLSATVMLFGAGVIAAGVVGSSTSQSQPTASKPAINPKPLTDDPQQEDLERRLMSDVKPLLAKYCFSCHANESAKGDVRLDQFATIRDVMAMADKLSMARELVHTREMPPSRGHSGRTPSPLPSDHERLIIDQWLEEALAYVPANVQIDPGWFTIHRLNRTEYRNTIRDLLGVDPASHDISERLPVDDSGYGFDNIADVLTVSPLAIEAYLDAAERALSIGLGPEVVLNQSLTVTTLRPSRGGNQLPGGGVHLYAAGAAEGSVRIPATGEYNVTVRAYEDHAGDEHAALSLRIDGKEVKGGRLSVRGRRDEPETFVLRLQIQAGERSITAHFTNDYYKPNVADRNLAVEAINVTGPLDERTTIRTTGWTSVFGGNAKGSEESRAAAVLTRFAERAYRRPLRQGEGEALMRLYKARRRDGSGWEGAVRDGLCAVLVSPSFLYRSVEKPQAVDMDSMGRWSLSGIELASRLSYFLWSSCPDDELMNLAKQGRLTEPAVLRAQTTRMLNDQRVKSGLITNFTGQWLQLRALRTLEIDRSRFASYTDELMADMIAEASATVGHTLRSGGKVADLLESDGVFVNRRLAEHYGLRGVDGNELRYVKWPDEFLRSGRGGGGILTMAGVLTVTSNTTRTSPVKRGLFVLDQVLGTPPPPPPADIPPLEQAVHAAGASSTLRQQLAAHVANPTCAACHNRLDPLGLAFENFDAVGRWRTDEHGLPIDPSGVLPGGVEISGPAALRKVLLARKGQFVLTLAGKMLTYAVGRGTEPFDRPAVRSIAQAAGGDDAVLAELVHAVVQSETFRTCRERTTQRVPPKRPTMEQDDE